MNETVPEPTSWAEKIAAQLHRIADKFAEVEFADVLPGPRSIQLSIQPGGKIEDADDEVIGTVDAIGRALFGTTGFINDLSSGGVHYKTSGKFGQIDVTAFREISAARVEQMRASETLAAKEAELATLRAEVEKLRGVVAERSSPWFAVGDRVAHRGWENSQYARAGLDVVGTVVEVMPIDGSYPIRQQFRAEGADWCGAGSMWNHSDEYELVEADPDPTGLAYSRPADDPAPVSPGRVPPHTGGMTDEGLVDESEPVAVARHEISTAWKGDEPGECGAECRCGVTYDGFNSLAEAEEHLLRHIEAATSSTGLTKAADESRGALAGTTPVVTYFSFGHGQKDPDTGKSLINHYVTVVAPTYEACREAMFASRFGREWSFDYLAGTAKATNWIPRWVEHEVIVAPGTDQTLADQALAAAMRVLDAEPVSEAR